MVCTLQRGLLALVLIAACGCDSNSSLPSVMSPTSPSGSNSSSGATVSGFVASGSGTTQSTSTSGGRVMDVAGVKRVEIIDTNISSNVDSQGRFSLAKVPSGSVMLKFTGTGVNATTTVNSVAA